MSRVRTASAHCDTEDGPAVIDGRRALETGNVNIALKWVHQADEEEVRDAFTRAVAVRDLSPEARDLADRYFLDVLIRVHRAGEGAGFDGIKPTGTHVPPQAVAADEAHAVGRGDLVVLDSPVAPDQHVVKRVVGLPGEKVTFDAERVSIDGRPLPEPYASPSVFRGEYDVPPGHFLVLGDNRGVSSDSRSWPRPYTPRAAMRGRLLKR